MNKEPKYQSLSHWGLFEVLESSIQEVPRSNLQLTPQEEKEELKHMSDIQAFKELGQFYQRYKTDRKFKTSEQVLFYHYELGWVPAVILKKYEKTYAQIAYMLEDQIQITDASTAQLMKPYAEVAVGGRGDIPKSEPAISEKKMRELLEQYEKDCANKSSKKFVNNEDYVLNYPTVYVIDESYPFGIRQI